MPDQSTVDQAAHDYGMYVSKIASMKQEAEDLQGQIATLQSQRTTMNDEIGKTQTAMIPLRNDLLQLEKDIEDAKQKKIEVSQMESATFEGHQKILAGDTDRLSKLADELEKRGFALESRESAVKTAEADIDAQQRKIIEERDRIAKRDAEIDASEKGVVQARRDIEAAMAEAGALKKDAEAQELSWKSAQAQTRADRIAIEEESARNLNSMTEAKGQNEILERKKKEVNSLIPVAKEMIDYINSHMQDPDGMKAMFTQLFPTIANDL